MCEYVCESVCERCVCVCESVCVFNFVCVFVCLGVSKDAAHNSMYVERCAGSFDVEGHGETLRIDTARNKHTLAKHASYF